MQLSSSVYFIFFKSYYAKLMPSVSQSHFYKGLDIGLIVFNLFIAQHCGLLICTA